MFGTQPCRPVTKEMNVVPRRGQFPLVEQYLGRRLGTDLSSLPVGRTEVVETTRRLERELSYGYLRALWWLVLGDGRSVVSVPPGCAPAVREIVEGLDAATAVHDRATAPALRAAVDVVLLERDMAAVGRELYDVCFACNGTLLRRHDDGDCRRLTDNSIPAADGLELPTHCLPDGIVYAVVVDGRAVSIAHAHRTGVMEERVADLGVPGTAEPYRRRGYARTAVSAVVSDVVDRGGEALYVCSPRNEASIATAHSVGFALLARSLVLSSPAGA
jgi:hypothetical protein